MKKKLITLALYIIVAVLYSCEPVVEYVEVEKEVIITETVETEVLRDVEKIVIEYVGRVETVTEYIEVAPTVQIVEKDVIINTETIIYEEREVYIMSVEEIPKVQPITEYSNYVTLDNKVFGVVEDGFTEIPLITGLFRIEGILYFSIGELFYSQEKGVIKEIAEFPIIPASDFVEFSNGVFKIENDLWDTTPISRVYKNTFVEAYLQINGACMRGNDLLFSVSIGTTGRECGVFIWTANSGGTLSIFDNGRIW